MKWILLWLISVWLMVGAIAGGPTKIEHPTKRMLAISEKYHIDPIYMFHEDTFNADWWAFAGSAPGFKYHALLVVVPANATNHEVEASIMAVEHCAKFYEEMEKQNTATPDQRFQPGI